MRLNEKKMNGTSRPSVSSSLVFLFVFLFLFSSLYGQDRKIQRTNPRLVVNMVIDGLRSDYISLFWNDFGNGGFRRLIGEGTYCRNMLFPYRNVGRFADYATFTTGALPSDHGICADRYYEGDRHQTVSCLFDSKVEGVGSEQKLSPVGLESSTLSDELRLSTQGKGKIVTVAIDAEPALILSGHSGKVVWMSEQTGKWATSTYYSNLLPSWAVKSNGENQLGTFLEQDWTNLYSPSSYRAHSAQKFETSFFNYSFTDLLPREQIRRFKSSPYANEMVCELATQALQDEYLGVDDVTDMLNLQLTLRVSDLPTAEGVTAEVQDMYLRLDARLQELLKDLDELCGVGEVLYVITSPQEQYVSPEYLKNYGIPSGYFVSDRARSLLSTYLMATYGQADFVRGYYRQQLFLDHHEIREKGLDYDSVSTKVAHFMARFEGVQMAFRKEDMERVTNDDKRVRMARNSFSWEKSGDILIYLKPGWVEVEKETEKVGLSSRINNYAPFILSGWNVRRQVLNRTISALDVAPTVSVLLHLPFTNANEGAPLFEVIK